MIRWLTLMAAATLSVSNVVLINHTGLKIVRIQIGDKKIEETDTQLKQIFISVTPEKHDLKLVFKGGAQVDWPAFDFHGVHQVIFERVKNKINAHFE